MNMHKKNSLMNDYVRLRIQKPAYMTKADILSYWFLKP